MPLLMTQKVDRQLLYLNDGVYAVYIEAADKKAGDPWVRWARNFERALPLTIWDHFGKSLSHETYERDSRRFNDESQRISEALRQGRVVVFPGDEYSIAVDKLKETSPKLADRISQSIQGFMSL